ncbi:hypothetical protein [Methanosarcina sp. WWM596]|nr:hypothetical protein [Methanosarcina sp. WWM596]
MTISGNTSKKHESRRGFHVLGYRLPELDLFFISLTRKRKSE